MASLFFLLELLAGGLLGTQIVGVLSDTFLPIAGSATEALRWSMALGAMVTLWAAVHFWLAGRAMRENGAATGANVAISNIGVEAHS
jgi:hypothetical protein